MSLIEQAAKRLAELQRAGAEISEHAAEGDAHLGQGAESHERVPTPEALVRQFKAREEKSVGMMLAAERAAYESPTIAPHVPGHGVPSDAKCDIDLARLKALGYATPDDPQSQVAQEFRVLKRPIIRNAQGPADVRVRNGALVMVTSAMPGEGKTFTATNLAMSMAMEFDNTVLLVDGDVAHPSLPRVLGIPSSPGLLDLLLREDLDVSDVLLQTNLAKLTILPAGAPDSRATELLASERMAVLLRELASRYPNRIIIFDSPPLLVTTEARVLASHMGQVIMVVAADTSLQSAVTHALATIENCEVVLMVLNKAIRPSVGSYYGYYGYRPGGEDPHGSSSN